MRVPIAGIPTRTWPGASHIELPFIWTFCRLFVHSGVRLGQEGNGGRYERSLTAQEPLSLHSFAHASPCRFRRWVMLSLPWFRCFVVHSACHLPELSR
jgi:hypothetical protein